MIVLSEDFTCLIYIKNSVRDWFIIACNLYKLLLLYVIITK